MRFNLDGATSCWGHLGGLITDLAFNDVSESGFAVGRAPMPGTLASAGAIWYPDGETSRLLGEGTAISVADRLDGRGVNIGFEQSFDDYPPASVLYGNRPIVELEDSDGQLLIGRTLVSQSEFAIVDLKEGGIYGYYPGLVPGKPNAALPIKEIFPELAAVDFSHISKPYSFGGNIYMALTGNDGLILFGAADPSLVPEPLAAALLLAASLALVGVRHRGPSY